MEALELMPAPAQAVALNGEYVRFMSCIGIDDGVWQYMGAAEFVVRGDGVELYRSGRIEAGDFLLEWNGIGEWSNSSY